MDTAQTANTAGKKTSNPLRQMLMRVGGTFTVVMAGANLTPEEVAAEHPELVTEEEMLRIMTGSDPDVPVSKLALVAELFGAHLVLGLNVQAPAATTAKEAPSTLVRSTP